MDSVLLLHEVRQIHSHFIKITLVEIADNIVQLWLLSHFPVNTTMHGCWVIIIMWE